MTEIQKITKRPERCIGAHGFNPPHLIRLVELIPGDATADHTVKRTFPFMQDLGKVPIVVKKEVAAYLGNRIQKNVFQASYDIVESGIASVEDVDQALTAGLGIRWAIYGPFLVTFFNSPSHLMKNIRVRGLVKQGIADYDFLQDKSFEELVRWRDHKLIDLLRVLEHLPPHGGNKSPVNE
jgi:3-hydroxyacyl-CoA dehydrogenase